MKRLIIICFVFLFFGGYIFAQGISENVGSPAIQIKLFCQSDTLSRSSFHFKNLTIREKLRWDSCSLREDLLCHYNLRSYMQTKNEINEKISLSLNSFNFRDSLSLSVNLSYSPWVELKRWRYTCKPLDVQEWCHQRFISEPSKPITPQEEFFIYRVIAEENAP